MLKVKEKEKMDKSLSFKGLIGRDLKMNVCFKGDKDVFKGKKSC